MPTPEHNRAPSYRGDYMLAGAISQELVLKWLRAKPNVRRVEDVSEDKLWQRRDVDALVWLEDGRELRCEIKRDEHLGVSGNVLFEFARIYHQAPADRVVRLGWSSFSWADLFLFHAASRYELWWCRAADLRRALQAYTAAARQAITFRPVPTDRGKTTVNVLIPEAYCRDIFTIRDLRAAWDAPLALQSGG